MRRSAPILSSCSPAANVASSLASSLSDLDGGGGEDDAPKLAMQLPAEWQDHIRRKVLGKLDLVTRRCTVLAIDDGHGANTVIGPAPY